MLACGVRVVIGEKGFKRRNTSYPSFLRMGTTSVADRWLVLVMHCSKECTVAQMVDVDVWMRAPLDMRRDCET